MQPLIINDEQVHVDDEMSTTIDEMSTTITLHNEYAYILHKLAIIWFHKMDRCGMEFNEVCLFENIHIKPLQKLTERETIP